MSAHLPVGAEDLTKAPALAEDLSKAIAGRSPNMQEPQEEFFNPVGPWVIHVPWRPLAVMAEAT